MGITEYKHILGYYGCKPGCRKCCKTVENMVNNHYREKTKKQKKTLALAPCIAYINGTTNALTIACLLYS